MTTLEKILQEIEERKEKCLSVVKIEVDPMEIAIHREQYKGLRMAEDIIKKHQSCENHDETTRQSRDNDGWIPVEKELPPEPPEYVDDEDDLEEYIVMIDGAERPTTLRYAGDGTWWEDGTYYHVIAWCPLPERYRPESKTEKPKWREDMLRKFDRRE